MRRPRSSGLVLSCAFLLAAASLAAQRAQKPVFRADVALVQIDVVVIDADGRPVRGLTKDDFTLIDHGTPRPIETIAEFAHEQPADTGLPVDLPLDVADNRTAASDRLVMIVLDDLHFRDRTDAAKAVVRRVVAGIGTGASIGMVTTSGTFGVEVTEDRAHVLRAVDEFLDRFDPGRGMSGPLTAGTVQISGGGAGGLSIGSGVSPDGGGGIRSRGPSDLGAFFSAVGGYSTVDDVARMIGATDGRRKVFVWVAAGLPGADLVGTALSGHPSGTLDKCEGGVNPWFCNSINKMFDKLRRSGVTVYTVDPGGPKDFGAAVSGIAAATGGFSVSADALDAGLSHLIADLNNYYGLGFRPDRSGESGDRDYRQIEVRVNRPGATVRHRAGYSLEGPPPPPKNESPLGALVAPVMPNGELPLRLGAVGFLTRGSDTELLTTLEVDLGEFPPAGTDGRVTETVDFGVFAVDLKKKSVTRREARQIQVEWPVVDGVPTGAPRFRIQSGMKVPPGMYQLRASVIAKRLGTSGSVYLQADVPAPRRETLAIGGLALAGIDADAVDARIVRSAALERRQLSFAPSLDRRFRPDETLRIYFDVRTPAAAEGTLEMIDATGRTRRSIAWQTSGRGLQAVALRLPLEGLSPGVYRLRARAALGLAESVREVGLRIDDSAPGPADKRSTPFLRLIGH